ncbi:MULTISPECIES: ABC transporter substrate-binding protein [unclassified Bordetella]|uniref:ABC transporter substrate-binding protein n=1 Tax=unclassified Bordetella TaxID=2630031 RepID=UPI00132768BB|nr:MULTISPECIES: ABC transporter substrate-binding protein [unclassified Bordetella]MVW71324.1 ABC transporter substrate-binding protein [Bordetella sp. 15P40C-2]MVW79450.1 ABC transporter substrate-binding protein [Bordetella sp. 02P26C-1]
MAKPHSMTLHALRVALMAGTALGAGVFAPVQAQTVTAVMHAGLRSLDPVITTGYIVRNHGYMVYDTLFSLDADNKIQPQMLESWQASDDGKTYTFVLRDGLKWHDGAPVTAADCVASIKRWASQDKMGQMMAAMMSGIEAVDGKTFKMTFNEPTDIAIRALAKPSAIPAFMMPERVANTPGSQAIKETIGSGPFRFVTEEYKPGVQVVYEKNTDYVPRKEPASGLAGGKVVKVDKVKWVTMPDQMTAVNALINNEIDFIEQTPYDLLPMLENNEDITLNVMPSQGGQSEIRFNFEQPPFNNKLIRQAALLAVDQKEVLQAQIGNPKYFQTCPAVFGCGGPYESDIGGDKLVKGNPEKAAALLKEAGYDGTPVVILMPSDNPTTAPIMQVTAQQLRKAGFKVDLQAMDWQTVLNRRASHEPASKGGWNIFGTFTVVPDIRDPLSFMGVAANGTKAWFGWPDVPEIEKRRAEFARTNDPATLKRLANEIQELVIDEGVIVPLGQFSNLNATGKQIKGVINGPVPVFWNLEKTGK